ncbi:MAG TPA: c-type cytochrome [Leucothrix mucor]|nr:c-type cytochrome [Leucothrix mucor]
MLQEINMSNRAPKVDNGAKLVFLLSLVFILLAVFVLVSSLINTIKRNTTKGEIDTTSHVASASANLKPEGYAATSDTVAVVAPTSARSGKEVYDAVCMACHATGVAGSPKTGDKAAWEPRVATGMDAMMTTAINGKGAMPARGGRDVGDEELKAAIIYMTKESGFDLGEAAPAAAPVKAEAAPVKTEVAPVEAEAPAVKEEKAAEAPKASAVKEEKAAEAPKAPAVKEETAAEAPKAEVTEVAKVVAPVAPVAPQAPSAPEMTKLYFDTGSTALPANTDVSQLVDYVKNNDKTMVVISGFHDATGSADANAEISKKRAQAVAKLLTDSGLPEDAIKLEKPMETTGSGSGKEARRVELLVKNQEPQAVEETTPVAPKTVETVAPVAAAVAAVEVATAPATGDGAALYVSKGCVACHGADAKSPIMPLYPRIAGQSTEYITTQMTDIKSGARSNGQSAVMKGIMASVSEAEIAAIAGYLSGL